MDRSQRVRISAYSGPWRWLSGLPRLRGCGFKPRYDRWLERKRCYVGAAKTDTEIRIAPNSFNCKIF